MALPIPLLLGGAAALFLLLRKKDETLPPAPPANPAALPPAASAPPPPSKLLTEMPLIQPSLAPKGYGAEVFLSFNPLDTSVKQNVQAMRYLGFTGLIPSDVQGDATNADYMDAVKVFQDFAKLPKTGQMDAATQNALVKQVIARNVQVHQDNASKGLADTDWISYQTKLGMGDPRGAWSIL